MTATRDHRPATTSPHRTSSAPRSSVHDLNDINCRVDGETNRAHWLRMPHGPERNHALALWTLAELAARRVSPSCIEAQKRVFIQRGLLQAEKRAGESLF